MWSLHRSLALMGNVAAPPKHYQLASKRLNYTTPRPIAS